MTSISSQFINAYDEAKLKCDRFQVKRFLLNNLSVQSTPPGQNLKTPKSTLEFEVSREDAKALADAIFVNLYLNNNFIDGSGIYTFSHCFEFNKI